VPRRLLPAVLAGLTLALAACGSSDSSSSTSTPAATATTTASAATTAASTAAAPATAANGCKTVDAQAPVKKKSAKPTTKLAASAKAVVTMQTSCGEIQITLDAKDHPVTASSFASLVKSGFYDGLGVVRVVPGFVLQAGDPNGDGSGGASYQVVEAPGNNAAYRQGVVAMAKTGSDPAGASSSQFFIVTGADAGLPPEYAIAGRVTKGLDVAKTIGAIPPEGGQDGPPTQPVLIEKATLSVK
jgi:cyclophilin family peptidyl-prolyl cis-trans isomerase